MRVTNQAIFSMVKLNLGKLTEDLAEANKTVASGKRISELSDDPVGLTQILHIKSDLSNMEQLGRNVTHGKAWLTASETAMRNVQNIVLDAKALSVQMGSANIGSAERGSAAETVQNMLEEIISLANTDIGGRFIFAGSETGTNPFAQDGTYNGDNNPFTIKIGQTTSVEVGRDGEAVFKAPGKDIFQILNDFKTALEGDDISGIQDAMGNLETFFDHIAIHISDVGYKTIRMEVKESIFQDMDITKRERLSKIEDADIAAAITDLAAKQLAYQAALNASSKVMTLSLVDYLR